MPSVIAGNSVLTAIVRGQAPGMLKPITLNAGFALASVIAARSEPAPVSRSVSAEPAKARSKLSYKEQRELDALPGRIEAMEAEQGPFNLTRYGEFLDSLPEMPWAE